MTKKIYNEEANAFINICYSCIDPNPINGEEYDHKINIQGVDLLVNNDDGTLRKVWLSDHQLRSIVDQLNELDGKIEKVAYSSLPF